MKRKEVDVDITPHHRPTEYVQATAYAGIALSVFLFVLSLLIVKMFQRPVSFLDFLNDTINIWTIEIFILLATAIVTGSLFAVWKMRQGRFIPVEQSGGYWRDWRGMLTPLPPLAITTPVITVNEQKPSPLRLASLIHAGSLTRESADGLLMFQGMRRDGTMRYGKPPGVIGVAGAQNVGKSVTIANLTVMFVVQHAYVVVCDTHHAKTRSLYRKLEALEEHVVFAKTEEEVLEQSQLFSKELANRKRGSNPYPYVFILDEAASILKRSDVGKSVIPIIEQCGQEGQGFNMTIMLGIHDFSRDGLGDVRIRDYLNYVYCHRMESGQSKFIPAFNDGKIKYIIASLPAGHAMVKDELNKIEYLIMPFADSSDVLVAKNQLASLQSSYILPKTVAGSTDDLEPLPPLV